MSFIPKSPLRFLFNLFTIVLISQFFSSCSDSASNNSANPIDATTKVSDFVGEQINDDNFSLLVIGDDRSGSTSVNRKLTKDEYEEVFKNFIKSSYGTIAVRVIGNPKNDNLEFHRLKVLPSYKKILIDESKDPTLTERGKINLRNKQIVIKNDSIKQINEEHLNSFLDKIDENVINYKKAGKDLTDINDIFSHLNDIVNESEYKKAKKITIVLLSDGIHDATKEKVNKINFDDKPVEIHLIGWKDKSVFSLDDSKINCYESKDGFLETTKSIFKP